jgi:hypothetical protein
MAHPLTHLTHGIPTRRPFHPAKTASAIASSLGSLWLTLRPCDSPLRPKRLFGVVTRQRHRVWVQAASICNSARGQPA